MKFAGQAYRIPRELPLDVEDPLIDIRSAHALNVARNLGRPGAIDETHAAVSRFASWLTAQVQILSSLGSSLAKNHDKEKDPGFIPATPPAHLPAIDLLADLNGSGQAKEFGLKFHGSHLCLWLGCTVKPRKRSTASTQGRGVEV